LRNRKFDIRDVIIIIGWLGTLVGIWLIYWPAAYIVAGISLVCLGLIGGNSTKEDKK
jgi:hypothetical protein